VITRIAPQVDNITANNPSQTSSRKCQYTLHSSTLRRTSIDFDVLPAHAGESSSPDIQAAEQVQAVHGSQQIEEATAGLSGEKNSDSRTSVHA
jgi:hypothetical protein